MKTKILSICAVCIGLSACTESVPNPSGTYEFKEEGILRAFSQPSTWKISPLTDGKDGKFKVEATYKIGKQDAIFFFVKNSKNKFCDEKWGDLNKGCFEYDPNKGVRLDGQTEFSKKVD